MANNNFFLSQDPLLYQSPFSHQFVDEETPSKKYEDAYNRYKYLQNNNPMNLQKDYIGEFTKMNNGLSGSVLAKVASNDEFNKLYGELNMLIQSEILESIKWKINANPSAVSCIEKLMGIMNTSSKSVEEEQMNSLNELNDYVKNYSNMTFDDYKQMKNGNNKKSKKYINDDEGRRNEKQDNNKGQRTN